MFAIGYLRDFRTTRSPARGKFSLPPGWRTVNSPIVAAAAAARSTGNWSLFSPYLAGMIPERSWLTSRCSSSSGTTKVGVMVTTLRWRRAVVHVTGSSARRDGDNEG